jgi:hypothetical protein
VSAVSLAQFTGTNAKLWDIPAPVQRAEPLLCPSNMPHASAVAGFVVCDVDHAEQGTDVHGALVNGHWFSWSTRQATAAWAAVSQCAHVYCPQIVAAGQAYCSSWCARQDKHAADDRDAESEAA